MSKLDDILKKSISGKTSDTYVRSGEIDTILEKSRRGEEAAVFNMPKKIEPPAPVAEVEKPGIFTRVRRAAEDFIARPEDRRNAVELPQLPSNFSSLPLEEKKKVSEQFQLQNDEWRKQNDFWHQLPAQTVENLPFGVGKIVEFARDNPEAVGNVDVTDVLQAVVDVSKGTFSSLIGTAASLYPKPLKFNVPVLGEVTNLEFNAAQRIANGDNPATVVLEEGVVNNIFGMLMLVGLATEVAGPRPKTIMKTQFKGETPSGITTVNKPRSFRLYTEPTANVPVNDSMIQQMASQKGITLPKTYDPTLPTYFKMTGTAGGMIKGELVQIRPSYLQTWANYLKVKATPAYDYVVKDLGSSGRDFNRAIESGDKPVSAIYKDTNGTLQPNVAKQTVNDLALKLDNAQPGLGEQFKNSVKLDGATPTSLIQQATDIYNKSLGIDLPPPEKVFNPIFSKEVNINDISKVDLIPETTQTKQNLIEKTNQLITKLPSAVANKDAQVVSLAQQYALETGDTELINKVNQIIGENQKTNKGIEQMMEQSVQTPEKQLTQPAFTPYKSARKPTINAVYGNTPSDKFIVGTYDGKPYTTNAYILEFNSDVTPPAKALLFNQQVGADKVPDQAAIEKLMPKDVAPVELTKVYGEEGGKMELATLQGENGSLNVQRKYFDYFNNKYKNPQFFAGKQGPILVMKGGQKVGLIMPMANDISIKKPVTVWEKPKTAQPELTQAEQVKEAVKEGPKSIKEIAEETKIKEPNIRRILGVGAKEGVFERVEKGVYVLSKNGIDMAYVETADALESLPKLAEEGFKADMVFLDIPYKTAAVTGGNRGVKYNLISPEEFKTVIDSVKKIAQTEDSPIIYMYSQARSGLPQMAKYTKVIIDAGLKPIGKGEYTKLQKDGVTQVRNMRGNIIEPEGIMVFNSSGKLNPNLTDLNFKLIRPKGYQTEKPAEMMKKLIEMTTEEGEMVLDPFAGSGVTGAEAVKAKRMAYLIEKDAAVAERYTRPRVKEALGETSVAELSKIAENSLENSTTGARDRSIKYFEENPETITAEPIRVRKIGNRTVLEDGRHRLEAARKAGIENIKTIDVSKNYASDVAESLSDEGLGSPVGNKTIRRKVEEQNYKLNNGEVQEVPDDFKISQRAKDILAEFGVVINEKQVPNKYLGFYKYITKKVRVQALYDVTTVTHEAIHAIDAQINFSKNLINETGRGADIRKQLTDIYEDIYPGAKRTHPLDKRIKEGLAVFFENYFYDPASIKAEYPDLVDAFLPETGKYYDPLFNKLLDRMNQLVDDYARLTPEQRFASRIRTGKEVVDNDTGFTWKQKLEFEIFNRYEPLKRYGKMAGVEGTWNDPLIQSFNMMNKNAIAASWVKGEITPILMSDGNFKLEKGTVKDYLEIIKKLDLFEEGKPIPKEATETMTGAKGVFKAAVRKISDIHGYSPFKEYNLKTYRSYLVARRVVADNNKLRMLENTARELEEFTKTLMGEDFANAAGDIEEIKMLKAQIQKLKEIIARDDFSLQDASAVVEKYTDKFKEADAIYDGINKKMIEMAVENELIPVETANEMLQEKGYASFRRYIDEDLNAVGTIRTSTKTKVSAFKERTGSQLDIVDPIYSQMQSINEIISKSLENRLWLKVADLTRSNPDIARRFEKIAAVPSIDDTGRISYPQEKQEGVIRVFRKGKREFYKAGAEFQAVAKTMRPKELDLLSKVMRIPSSLFTRLTTSANPLFAIGNLSVDQFSALSQTKTGFKPVVDPAKAFVEYVKGTDGINAYIALGGKRQTLAGFYDLSPEQIEHKLTGGLSTYEKVSGVIDYGVSILEMPSNTSEIMTRYSEFKRAKDQGDSDSVAMYKASEVTTPFQLMGNLGGQFGQAYIKSIPYLNAQLQVLYKWGRAGKDNPKRMGTVMGGLLVAGLTAAILAMKYSTDEQKRTLGEQPVRNMSRYIYLPSPNGKDLIKFRIPEIMGIFTGMGYLFVIDKYGGNKATFDDYETVVSSTLPEQIQFWNPTKMAVSILPQIIKPGVQVAFNTKVFPELAPIVPEYMLNKKPSEQYNSYSSKMSLIFGDMFGLSPIKSEFLLRNQFGVVGGLLVGKTPGNPLYIDEEKYVMAGRSYNRFYDDKVLATQAYQDIVKDNPDKYTYEDRYAASQEYKTYNKVADILADMRKIGEDKLTDETKNFAYDTLIKLNEAKSMDEVIPDLYKWRDLVTRNANVK